MATKFVQPSQSDLPAAQTAAQGRYLHGPLADFITFGGSSLIVLPLLMLLPVAEAKPTVLATIMMLSHFINYPHFANSYQLFYRNFRAKAFGQALENGLSTRYLFAGLGVPVLLVAYFAWAIVSESPEFLGYAGNAMFLFVGWHYVKQGYGLLMVDCALKRQFFTPADKKLLLINAYTVWFSAWVLFNDMVRDTRSWGITSFNFNLPQPLVWLAIAAVTATSAATLWMLFSRRIAQGSLPLNGVIAYAVSLYPWLLLVNLNPLWLLVAPTLHSLQYLAVVWRFQVNYETAQLPDPGYKQQSLTRQLAGSNPAGHLFLFVLVGGLLGYLGFWLFPRLFDALVPYDKELFGATLFMFVAWTFINVHHYFIDNVIWRRDNPETKAHLFG